MLKFLILFEQGSNILHHASQPMYPVLSPGVGRTLVLTDPSLWETPTTDFLGITPTEKLELASCVCLLLTVPFWGNLYSLSQKGLLYSILQNLLGPEKSRGGWWSAMMIQDFGIKKRSRFRTLLGPLRQNCLDEAINVCPLGKLYVAGESHFPYRYNTCPRGIKQIIYVNCLSQRVWHIVGAQSPLILLALV